MSRKRVCAVIDLTDDELELKRQRKDDDSTLGPKHTLRNPPQQRLRPRPQLRREPDGTHPVPVKFKYQRFVQEKLDHQKLTHYLAYSDPDTMYFRGSDDEVLRIGNSVGKWLGRLKGAPRKISLPLPQLKDNPAFLAFAIRLYNRNYSTKSGDGVKCRSTGWIDFEYNMAQHGFYYGKPKCKQIVDVLRALFEQNNFSSYQLDDVSQFDHVASKFKDVIFDPDTTMMHVMHQEGDFAKWFFKEHTWVKPFTRYLELIEDVTVEEMETKMEDFLSHIGGAGEFSDGFIMFYPYNPEQRTIRFLLRSWDDNLEKIDRMKSDFDFLLVQKVAEWNEIERMKQQLPQDTDSSVAGLEIEKKIAERSFQSRGQHDRDFSERSCDICADDERLVGKRCECEFEQCVWCWSQGNCCPQCRREIIPQDL